MSETRSQPRSIHDLFRRVVEANPHRVAYRQKRAGAWRDITWSEHRETVARHSRALIALGIEHGDRVAILGGTRLEWIECDMGILLGGGVTIGIYHSSLPDDCAYILNHSGARLVFVEDRAQLDKIVSVRDQVPELRHVVVLDADGPLPAGVLDRASFLERADEVEPRRLEQISEALGPDDLLSFVYTSGTTGRPKGAMISHGNLMATVEAAYVALSTRPHYETLLFLPLAHVFARMIAHLCMAGALTVSFAENLTTIARDMREIRPHFILGVPRIYEKMHDAIVAAAERAGGLRERIFRWAIDVGLRASRHEVAQRRVPPTLALQRAIADRLVFRKIRENLGGRLAWVVSGAAPLNPSICEFFLACGIPMLEGLGMTENTSLSNVNPLARIKPGTVGPAVQGIEMKLAPDGEVLFRGPNVMRGYYEDPAATAEAIDGEGWLHTGDVGEIDEDGYLRITDRKKDLIVTAGGKNVAPQRIERILRTSPYISQVVAYGDRRKFISALITLDPVRIGEWAAQNGLDGTPPESLAAHAAVERLIQGELDRLNHELASFESVKKFCILPRDLGIETGELTATLKVKRKVVYQKFGALLDRLYDEDAHPAGHA